MDGNFGCSGCHDVYKCLDGAMHRLVSIWDQIGIEPDQRRAREAIVLQHLSSLLEEMIGEEDLLRKKLLDRIQKFSQELFSVTEELGLPPFEPDDDCSVLQLEKKLRVKIGELCAEKQVRIDRLRLLKAEDERLCQALSATPYSITSGSVPSLRELEELQQHVKELEEEQERRWRQFSDIREEILQIVDDLAMAPASGFERSVIEDAENVSLTMSNINRVKEYHEQLVQQLTVNREVMASLWVKVKALWSRLNLQEEETEAFKKQITNHSNDAISLLKKEQTRCEQLRLQNIQNLIEQTRNELTTWWDRCYVLQEHRVMFRPFSEVPATEELLSLHEMELEAVKSYYEANKEILEKVARRQRLWLEFLELERKATNPDRFLNRGGNLLKEEKARKKLSQDLPKVEQELVAQIEDWERSTGRRFLISGMSFRDYVRKDHDNFAMEKENEKISRQQQKAKQFEEELKFGSKPVTPAALKRCATPTRNTPNKLRKVGTPSKAFVSVLGSQKNLTNIFSPLRSQSKETLVGSIPKGLNNVGLDSKSHIADATRGKGISGKACGSTSSGISSYADTVSSTKSLFSGKSHDGDVTKHQIRNGGLEIKTAKTKTEPYF